MPTDPSDPSTPTPSTRHYQTTSDSPKGGGGGAALFIILLVLLLGGGAAYYFLFYKPAAAVVASATPAPAKVPATPAPAKASPTPASSNGLPYTNEQRTQYIKQADDAYTVLRSPKAESFKDAMAALNAAGGYSAVGLTSKEAIAARRDTVSKCLAANDDLETFDRTKIDTYKTELQKTPLTPAEVKELVEGFAFKAQPEKGIQLRDLQAASLKTGDAILAFFDKTYGSWTINPAQRLSFKKGVDLSPLNALVKTSGEQAAAIQALQKEILAITDPNAPPSEVAAASPAAGSPAPSPAAGATPGSPVPSPAASAAP